MLELPALWARSHAEMGVGTLSGAGCPPLADLTRLDQMDQFHLGTGVLF